jgi:peroxiredoxin
MIFAACLVACTLTASQTEKASLLPWAVHLSRGQELVYRGSYAEENSKPGAKIARRFQVETRILVLESLPTGPRIAILTTVQAEKGSESSGSAPRTVHLELAKVDLKGRLALDGGEMGLTQDAPPKIEAGCFIELPTNKEGSPKEWVAAESGRPRHHWRTTGIESAEGQTCFKLLGARQSEDWDHPRAEHAWREEDTVWLSPQTGVAVRYERVIERRTPSGSGPGLRSISKFHLDSNLVYPGQLFQDRQTEINLFHQYSQLAEACFREPSLESHRRLEALAAKIAYHGETQSPTPYREALQELQGRVEAAARGDLPPVPTEPQIRRAVFQESAGSTPDFVANDLATGVPVRLQSLRGRPVLLLFYTPKSASATEMLKSAQALSQTVQVIGLSVGADVGKILEQRNILAVTFPIVSGSELRSAFGIDTTPEVLVIDEKGAIRRRFEGWGEETPALIKEELQRCSPEKAER